MLQSILDALNVHKRELLLMAEAMLLPHQLAAYRKLLLNRLGRQGFEGELERIIAEYEKQQRNGQGRANTSKRGGVLQWLQATVRLQEDRTRYSSSQG